MRLGLLVTLAALVVLAVAVLVPPARAAEPALPTRAQEAMDAAWLSHLAPEDLPPVDQRGIVCLVDTGVDVTPDLPEDRPEGPIVARRVASALRYDGDSDDGQGGTTEAGRHGTSMASLIAAQPGNDWGTVGLVPWVRVLSVRAMPKGAEEFPGEAYESGIRECQRLREEWPQLSVVSLALGCECALTERARVRLEDAVGSARDAGLTIVAAAGNSGASSLASPADVPGVLPVAAADEVGGLCDFSTWTAGTVLAPGCGSAVDPRSPGSSAAAIHVAAVAVVLRSLAVGSSAREVEDALVLGARSLGERRVVDARTAAVRLGLDGVLERADERQPAERREVRPEPERVATVSAAGEPRLLTTTDLPAPRVRVRRVSRGRIELRVLNRPRRTDVEVRVDGRTRVATSSRVALRWPRSPKARVRFLSDEGVSARVVVRLGREPR